MTNINVTPGTGKVVATETVGGVEYQLVKVVSGLTGSVTGATINTDGSMQVSVIGTIRTVGSVSGVVSTAQTGAWTVSVVGQVNVGSVLGPVSLYAPSASLVSGVTSIITTTAQTSVLATAPGAQRNYVTQILVTNAGAVATQVNIMDGPTVIYAGYAAASGGGFSLTFPAPLKQATLAQSLDVKAVTTTSITAAISGFTAA